MTRVSDFLADAETYGLDPRSRSVRLSLILVCGEATRPEDLAATWNTISEQTFRDFEALVVGEGLPDGTVEWIRRACARDSRISARLHHRVSELPALRLGEGILASGGAMLAYPEPGTEWFPDALERMMAACEAHPDRWIIAALENLEPQDLPRRFGAPAHYSALVEENPIALSGVMHSRRLLEEVGLPDPHVYLAPHALWDWWLRLAAARPWHELNDPVGRARSRPAVAGPFEGELREAAFRLAAGVDRRVTLSADRFPLAPVDTPDPWGGMPPTLSERLRKFVLLPWQCRHRCELGSPPGETLAGAEFPRLATVVFGVHSSTVDVTIGNVQEGLARRVDPSWRLACRPVRALRDGPFPAGDLVLLHRTFDPRATELQREARRRGVGTLYLADDDLLGLWEQFPEYRFLAPGEPSREELESQIAAADLVVLYSSEALDAYRRLNPRIAVRQVSIPASWLDRDFSEGEPGAPLRIGFAGSGARAEELDFLQPALEAVSKAWGERVEFWFWGWELPRADRLRSPYRHEPYSHSYAEYIRRLRRTHFDLLLAPLFDAPRSRRAKTCIKYLEITAAGTVGIYSDVPPYRDVPSPRCGLKVPNTVEAWREAIESVLRMPAEQRRAMWQAARDDVARRFTAEQCNPAFLSALHAAWLHGRTRDARHGDGRARFAFLFHSLTFAGSEIFQCRRADIVRDYGFEPVFGAPAEYAQRGGGVREFAVRRGIALHFLPMTAHPHAEYPPPDRLEQERAALRRWLRRERIALVHSTCFIPAAGLAARDVGIPHVASLYQPYREPAPGFRPLTRHADVLDSDSYGYAAYWEGLLECPAYVMRCPVPGAFFDVADKRRTAAEPGGAAPRLAVIGALHERKGQREVLRALDEMAEEARGLRLNLVGLSGYFPEYERECHLIADRLRERGVQVEFTGFTEDVPGLLEATDVLIMASRSESFPQVVLQAMAAGTLVISTPVAGVPELIRDGQTGLLVDGFDSHAIASALRRCLALSPGRKAEMLDRARRVVEEEASWSEGAHRLLWLYGAAFREARSRGETAESSASASSTDAEETGWRMAPCPWGWVEGISYPTRSVKRYRLSLPQDGLDGIQVRIGTHGRRLRASLRLRLTPASRHRGGFSPRTAIAHPEGWLEDPAWVTFRFPPVERCARETCRMEIRQEGAEPIPLSVFQFEPPRRNLWSRIRKRMVGGPAIPQVKLSFRHFGA